MDAKGFFLGLIAAVVLFLLWKKEQGQQILGITIPNVPMLPAPSQSPGDCFNCGGGASPSEYSAPPSFGAAPVVQGAGDGFISPGTPPMNGSAGAGSWYAASGPSANNTILIRQAPAVSATSQMVRAGTFANVPGSPTTPATVPPIRSVQRVPTYQQGGFQQRYNILGVPRPAARTTYLA